MDLIVAVDKEWGIGKKNDLLFHLPEDMRFFRQMTSGHTVVLGRKTLESFPDGKPLRNRRHIVLTHGEDIPIEGVITVHSLRELLETLEKIRGKVFLIGGASIYKQLYRQCKNAYVTKILSDGDAEVFFPDLDQDPFFRLVEEGEVLHSVAGVFYQFVKYENVRL